ncbi:MAG TPA: TolC family protein [Polyangiaceae bacterium]
MTRATTILAIALALIARPTAAQLSEPQLTKQDVLERSTADKSNDSRPTQHDVVDRGTAASQLLESYVRIAVANSPTLGALRARQSSAKEMVSPSGALPDPMVGIMYQSMGPPWKPMPPMSMVQGEISQVIPGVGKRQARRNAAQADADMRKTELDVFHIRIAADVRLLFSQIYAVDKERQSVESAQQLIGVMLGAVTGRFITGGADQEALAKAEVERSRLKEQLFDLRADREILVAKLNRLLARPDESGVPNLEALPEVSLDLRAINDQSLSKSSELRVQRAIIHASMRKRESAETETRPNFLVGFAGGATTTGEPVLTFRFGMELPIWRSTKQDPLVRAARNDTEAAEFEYRAMDLKLRGELSELRARFNRDTQQIALYRQEIIPKAALALHAARDAYSTGRADFSTVIEDYRSWLEAQIGLAKREADRLMTWTEYEAIVEGSH